MRRLVPAILLVVLALSTAAAGMPLQTAAHATTAGNAPPAATAYVPAIHGSVQGYRLAGVEPDGDPLYQVVLQTRLTPSAGLPPIDLIVSSYLENFRPDTTPVLPDLLHPNRTAHNLGGFLQGKVLLTDDAGNVLSIGSFLCEAFIGRGINSNHTVMTLYRSTTSNAVLGTLKGTFGLSTSGGLNGRLQGRLALSAANLADIRAHRGARMKPLKQIISVVTVKPHYYGTPSNGASGAPLHTGFGSSHHASPSPTPAPARQISPWTIVAGIGAIVSLLLAGFLYWLERRRNAQAASLQ